MADQHENPAPHRILDHEGFPGRWEILETAEETGGERFKTRIALEDRGELPPHLHPTAEESYEVIAGELEVQVDGEWSTVDAGEKVVIPPNTEHAFKTTGAAEVINIHQPAMQFEEFFRGFHRLKTERGVSMPPDDLKSAISLAMLIVEHEDEQRVVSPPLGRSRCWHGLDTCSATDSRSSCGVTERVIQRRVDRKTVADVLTTPSVVSTTALRSPQ